jgi:poly(A) polymerase
MLRAVALAARLGFALDPLVVDAIKQLRHEIARSSPARLLEEYYKILRAGSAEKTFRGLADTGLLEPISEELHRGATEALWRSLAAVDTYRQKFAAVPETLTNPVLLGSFLVPLGLSPQLGRPAYVESASGKKRPAIPRMGSLPLARRDVERLRQILGLQRRLRDLGASVRAQRALTHRGIFRDGLTWLEVHGDTPDLVEHWITVLAERGAEEPVLPAGEAGQAGEMVPFERRRRRRRRRRHRRPAP